MTFGIGIAEYDGVIHVYYDNRHVEKKCTHSLLKYVSSWFYSHG